MIIVDRIEGILVVCEQDDKSHIELPLNKLPPKVREGDCLIPQPDGSYRIDHQETNRRRQHSIEIAKRLFED